MSTASLVRSLGRLALRNRLVAVLSDAAVVTESRHRSLALKIAHEDRRRGRPVGAVPDEITSPGSGGTNELLRQHTARMITHGSDVINLVTAPRPATPSTSAGGRPSRRDPPMPRPPEPGSPDPPARIPL